MTLLVFALGLMLLLSACSKDSGGAQGGSGMSGDGDAKSTQLSNRSQTQNVFVPPVSGIKALVSRFHSIPTVVLSGLQARGMVQLFSDAACNTSLSQKIPVVGPRQSFATAPLPFGKHFIYAKSWDSVGNASACSTVFATYLHERAMRNRDPRSISAGKAHTCAVVDLAGRAKCWGQGKIGQLAGNATSDADVPRSLLIGGEDSELFSGAVQIDAGGGHTNALMKSGKVKFWGQFYDEFVVYGRNGFSRRGTPSNVLEQGGSPLSGIIQVSSGKSHSCALKYSGEVKCWGWGNYGELGNGSKIQKHNPVTVIAAQGSSDSLSNIVQISSGGEHTCALTKSGGVKCWGSGVSGQLGHASYQSIFSPVDVVAGLGNQAPLSGIVQVSSGGEHTCALTAFQTVVCWGDRVYGQLGNGVSNANSPVPVTVPLLSGIVQIAAGKDYTCALSHGGTVSCWGRGNSGQLGNGVSRTSSTSVTVIEGRGSAVPLSGVLQLAPGDTHACALMLSGEIKCWGEGSHGRLGDDSATGKNYPVTVVSSEGSTAPLKVKVQNLSFTCPANGNCAWDDFSLIALDLRNPQTSPNSVSTPQIRISPVKEGDRVSLYSDSFCAGEALASGTVAEDAESIDLVTAELVARENRIYARVGNLCSSNFVFYAYSGGTSRLALETESPSNVGTPTVQVNLLSKGDAVSLHLKSDCTDAPVANKAATAASESLATLGLGTDGFYHIYLKQNGVCYPDGIIYQLETAN